MKRWFGWAIALGFVLLVGFVSLVWLRFVFGRVEPAMQLLEASMQAAPPEDRDPPEVVRRMLRTDYREGQLRWQVARLMYHGYDPVGMEGNEGNAGWHKNGALWNLWLRWHRSDRDCESIVSVFAYSGEGRHGLSNGAQLLFQKPLSQLDAREAAEVVVLLRSPNRLLKAEQRRRELRDQLLARVG